MVLCAIQPKDNSLADFNRLVLTSELDPALEVVDVRRHRLLDGFPSCLRGLDVPTRARPRVQVVQVERHECAKHILSDIGERYRRKQGIGRSLSVRNEIRTR